jgi:hypothetical protein
MIASRATSNSLFIFSLFEESTRTLASHTATVNKARHHCPRDLDFLLPKAVGRRFQRISKVVYSRLAGIRLDGIARGRGQIWGQLVEGEPSDLLRFVWLAIPGFAADDAAEKGWRYPVLAFAGQAVIGDTEKTLDNNFDTGFFMRFADCAFF